MERLLLAAFVVFGFFNPRFVFAQAVPEKSDHLEVGAFADYFRLDRTDPTLNYAGVGGRLAFNVRPSVQVEAEMAYDFDRSYNNPFNDGTIVPSQSHILHGLFGPKFQTGSGPVRLFVTGKVGVISFTTNTQDAPTGFKSALGALGNGDAKFAVYPGGGLEVFKGPFGLRLEVGDDIYFDNGARNNLRVTFGPTIRF